MSYCVISFEITDYFPHDFNFDAFSFFIRSEPRDFEEEITVRPPI